MFGLSSSHPPLVGGSGGFLCESVAKANCSQQKFDSKQFRAPVDLPSISKSHYLCCQVIVGEMVLDISGPLWWH